VSANIDIIFYFQSLLVHLFKIFLFRYHFTF
jgi:hypothetical protein